MHRRKSLSSDGRRGNVRPGPAGDRERGGALPPGPGGEEGTAGADPAPPEPAAEGGSPGPCPHLRGMLLFGIGIPAEKS